MNDVSELIEYSNECEYLDFKQKEYDENNKPNLIKDVLAMANANIKNERYIIIGVKKKDKVIDLYNIESKYDSANIQQYILANIEPELNISYEPFQYNGYNLMVLKIEEPNSQPYFTKKPVQYPNGKSFLKINECWIRKGSYQLVASRNDFERIYAQKNKEKGFDGLIELTFEKTDAVKISLEGKRNLELPSVKYAKKIEEIIKRKEESKKNDSIGYRISNFQMLTSLRGSTYEERDLETLKNNLKSVDETYSQDNAYYIFETNSYKLNFDISNSGESYLEDCSVELKIPEVPKMVIAKEIHFIEKQSNSIIPMPYISRIPKYAEINYPKVEKDTEGYIIREVIGDLKHNLKQSLFRVPIRITIGDIPSNTEIKIECRIFGKNLITPIKKELLIIVK